jgi:hypothetical protein
MNYDDGTRNWNYSAQQEPPKRGDSCKHGKLARSCEICELTADRDALKAKCDALDDLCKLHEVAYDTLAARCQELRDALRRLKPDCDGTHDNCGTCKALATTDKIERK